MDKAELLEEIRGLLMEPQVETVEEPYHYPDDILIVQIRSAIRHLISLGVPIEVTVSTAGVFSDDLPDTHGLLVAYHVAMRLLRGDMIQKLKDGEMGVSFRAGRDVIDTKSAGYLFEGKADEYDLEYRVLLTNFLADEDGGVESVYGLQTNSFGV